MSTDTIRPEGVEPLDQRNLAELTKGGQRPTAVGVLAGGGLLPVSIVSIEVSRDEKQRAYWDGYNAGFHDGKVQAVIATIQTLGGRARVRLNAAIADIEAEKI